MFKDKLKQLRTEHNLTQADVANALGVSSATIGNYEQGTREPRNHEMWQKIADYFNVSVDELMDKSSSAPKSIRRIVKSEERQKIENYCNYRTDKPIVYQGVDITKYVLKEEGADKIFEEHSSLCIDFGVYSGHVIFARNRLLTLLFRIKKYTRDEIVKNLSNIIYDLEKNVIYWYQRCWNNISDVFHEIKDLPDLYDTLSACLALDDIAMNTFGLVPLNEDFEWLREKLHAEASQDTPEFQSDSSELRT